MSQASVDASPAINVYSCSSSPSGCSVCMNDIASLGLLKNRRWPSWRILNVAGWSRANGIFLAVSFFFTWSYSFRRLATAGLMSGKSMTGVPSCWMVFLSFDTAARRTLSLSGYLRSLIMMGLCFLSGGGSGEECAVRPLNDGGVGEIISAQSSGKPDSEKLNWVRAFTTLRYVYESDIVTPALVFELVNFFKQVFILFA